MTVGDLTAAHLGRVFTVLIPDDLVGEPREVTGPLARVQHNGAAVTPRGEQVPAQTLVDVGTWTGALPPTHPITEA